MPAEPLGILLISGVHQRMHAGFSLAAAAAALGRPVILFATGDGCRALMRAWPSRPETEADLIMQTRGVAGLQTLREALIDLGCRLWVCEAGLKALALDSSALLPQAQVAGLATFLAELGAGQIVSI